jgi:hypothetical protein
MKRHLIACLAAVLLAPVAAPMARAQSFPFEDAFTAYAPGSTGAPAWSILSGSFTTREGMLQGPVTIRFNARPPQQFVADLTLDLRGEPDGTAPREAALYYDHQHQADTGASDLVLVRARTESGSARTELVTGVERAGSISERGTFRLAEPSGPITLRVAVDTETGRIAAFVDGKPVVTSAPAEYGAGLLSVRLSDGARLDRIVLRVPTAEEKRSLLVTTLFNDPRDIADGDNGNLIVLHRGSPAVLTVTPDGEVTRTFGRRAPGGIPDPVAVDRGSRGELRRAARPDDIRGAGSARAPASGMTPSSSRSSVAAMIQNLFRSLASHRICS